MGIELTQGAAADYRRLLSDLLPPGIAWSRDPDSTLQQLLGSLAQAFARAHGAADLLPTETKADETAALLQEWEEMAGLPDDCLGALQDFNERRAAVVSRLVNRGGQSRDFYKALARSVGVEIEIEEFQPHRYGLRHGVNYQSAAWAFVWRITQTQTAPEYRFYNQARYGVRHYSMELGPLKCLVEKLKPAHTLVLYAYADIRKPMEIVWHGLPY